MSNAVCCYCIEDKFLSAIVVQQGHPADCIECGKFADKTFTVEELAVCLEPVLREHYVLGEEVKVFTDPDDDHGDWTRLGDDMDVIIQEITGQAKRINLMHYHFQWGSALRQMQHHRRFFNPVVKNFFEELFSDIETFNTHQLQTRLDSLRESSRGVIQELDAGSTFYRARICQSDKQLDAFIKNPFVHIGPPPAELSRDGRMNAAGISVLYASLDRATAMAELRPAMGG